MGDHPANWLRGLLGADELPDEYEDPLRFLAEAFGEPKRSDAGAGVERLSFALPDRTLDVLRSIATGRILGGAVFQQGAPPPPCPTPGPIGVTFTPTATGTAFYLINRANAFAVALARAVANGIANYQALRAIVCPLCPPPCTCTTPLMGVPTITQASAVRRVWGVPVGFDLTVTINATFNVICV